MGGGRPPGHIRFAVRARADRYVRSRPQVVDAVSVPVIAAGGIADGRGVAAAQALGASAVQMGTAFLRCPETAIPDAYRSTLAQANDERRQVTRAFTGRPARALRTRYVEELTPHNDELPEFPGMMAFHGPLRASSNERGSPDFMPLWSGQAAARGSTFLRATRREARSRLRGLR